MDAGGLKRQISVFPLPKEMVERKVQHDCVIPLNRAFDNPLWICVTTEDGFQGWSSPIFVIDPVKG